MKYFLILFFIVNHLPIAYAQTNSSVCLLLKNNESVCNEIAKNEIRQIKDIALDKNAQTLFKIVYAEVQILHKSGKFSEVFILKNGHLNEPIINYLYTKTFLGDAIIIDAIKVEDLNPNKALSYRDMNKKIFKIVEHQQNTTR